MCTRNMSLYVKKTTKYNIMKTNKDANSNMQMCHIPFGTVITLKVISAQSF